MKEKVLGILEDNRGNSVSGESLAKEIDVSRTSVWKIVRKLKSEGHKISSATHGGYRLENDSDVVYEAGVKRFLTGSHTVVVFDQIDSTNKQAKIMALNGAESGTIVVADNQTEGKGRRGRDFFSPKGSGAYFSIILRLHEGYSTCQRIVPLAAVAVTRVIKNLTGVDTDIKWVNDVYLNSKKIVGISTESIGDVSGNFPEAIILGIGVNVTTENFPPELVDKAGSLGISVNRNQLIASIVNEVIKMLPQLKNSSFMAEYRQKCFVLGKKVNVFYGDIVYEAKAVDVNADGALIVDRHGELVTLLSEEVSVKLE